MDLLEKKEKQAELAAKKVAFEVTYLPGQTADEDLFQATNENLSVTCYGPTREEALANAQLETAARLMSDSTLLNGILQKSVKAK